MAKTLDTAHPLYANIISCIGVDDDNTSVKDFASPTRICTLETGVSVVNGNLGYGVTLTDTGSGINPKGIALSGDSLWVLRNDTGDAYTVACIFNRWIGGNNSPRYPRFADTAIGVWMVGTGSNFATASLRMDGTTYNSSTSIPANTAAMVSMRWLAGTDCILNVNGTDVVTRTGVTLSPGDGKVTAIAGSSDALIADLFLFLVFNKKLSTTELTDLWNSCTGSGACALFTGGGGSAAYKTAKIQLYTSAGVPAANLTGLNFAYFEGLPPTIGNPRLQGSNMSTDASGWFQTNTSANSNITLSAGQQGYIVITNSNGTFTQDPPPIVYAGPIGIVSI